MKPILVAFAMTCLPFMMVVGLYEHRADLPWPQIAAGGSIVGVFLIIEGVRWASRKRLWVARDKEQTR